MQNLHSTSFRMTYAFTTSYSTISNKYLIQTCYCSFLRVTLLGWVYFRVYRLWLKVSLLMPTFQACVGSRWWGCHVSNREYRFACSWERQPLLHAHENRLTICSITNSVSDWSLIQGYSKSYYLLYNILLIDSHCYSRGKVYHTVTVTTSKLPLNPTTKPFTMLAP